MNIPTRILVGCTLVAASSVAAVGTQRNHLTVQRVLQLTTPSTSPAARDYRVEISSLGKALLLSGKPEGEITLLQEPIFPTEFLPPQPARAGESLVITPSTPTNFEMVHTGWKVRLSAKPVGKLVAVSGSADFVEANLVPSGYGEVAAPVYADHGDEVVVPNVMNMAKVQTTTTHFQIFAVPGETYEVTLYRGTKAEKHRVSVTAE